VEDRKREMRTTVPMHLDHNRPFIDVTLTGLHGQPRLARFWVDTGGGAFILAEPLARELGLLHDSADNDRGDGGEEFAAIPDPKASIGNLLKLFRLEIDYVNCLVYLEQQAPSDPNDMDLAGVILQPRADGGCRIVGSADTSGAGARKAVHIGDDLLAVDSMDVTHLTLGQTIDALGRKPGGARRLVLCRDGKRVEAVAPISRIV
jgi:hypothetical protein